MAEVMVGRRLEEMGRLDGALMCTHCGFCLSACPTYRACNQEMQSPRGRVSVILALRNGTLTPEEAGRALSYCLACRACHGACPAGVRVGKLVVAARSFVVENKPWMVRLFHFITDRRFFSRPVARLVRGYQRSRLRRVVRERWLTDFSLLQRVDALIPESRPPVRAVIRSVPSGEKPLRAALLCGCMARMFYPNVAAATASLLSHLNVDLLSVDGFGCCGAPHREAGNKRAFLRQAKKVLDCFQSLERDVDVIVCDTAVCAVTVKSYARALADNPEYGKLAKDFSERVVDFSALVLARCPDPATFFCRPSPQKIAFIDHCQTRHGSGILAEPRKLLTMVNGGVIELSRADQCCGAGGDTMLAHPAHSARIRSDKIKAIEEGGAQIVTGTNSGCLLNMEAGFKTINSPVVVKHLAEILWESCIHSRS